MGKLLVVLALLAVAWWVLRGPPARRALRDAKAPRAVPPRPARAEPQASDAVAMVRVYDAAAREVVWMAQRELSPGMVEARVEGVEGLVWVEPGARREGSPQEKGKRAAQDRAETG